jgi:methionyl-tRNA formyltransferase
MKILFAGSAPFSLPVLEYLMREKQVSGVLTAPDKPAGRGLKMTATPVKILADAYAVPVFQPEKLRGTFIDNMRDHIHAV